MVFKKSMIIGCEIICKIWKGIRLRGGSEKKGKNRGKYDIGRFNEKFNYGKNMKM